MFSPYDTTCLLSYLTHEIVRKNYRLNFYEIKDMVFSRAVINIYFRSNKSYNIRICIILHICLLSIMIATRYVNNIHILVQPCSYNLCILVQPCSHYHGILVQPCSHNLGIFASHLSPLNISIALPCQHHPLLRRAVNMSIPC